MEDPVVLLQEVKEEVEEESSELQETIITGKGKVDEDKDARVAAIRCKEF